MTGRSDSGKSSLHTRMRATIGSFIPGSALCALITLIAVTIQAVQESTVGHTYVEAIVIASLSGTAIRTMWQPGQRWQAGTFSEVYLGLAIGCLIATVALIVPGAVCETIRICL